MGALQSGDGDVEAGLEEPEFEAAAWGGGGRASECEKSGRSLEEVDTALR